MASPSKRRKKHRFYVSDYTGAFEKSTQIFFKNKLHLDEARIWD